MLFKTTKITNQKQDYNLQVKYWERKVVVKECPIVEWSNKDNNLPYHPLWDQGYVSVGDTHSTRPLEAGMSEEDTRFNGMGRECGLHVDGS